MSLVISFGKKNYNLQPKFVEYDVHIHNGLALATLKQMFKYDMKFRSIGTYQFPIDYKSTICSLLVRTPREDIKGHLHNNIENDEKSNFSINNYIHTLQIGDIFPEDIVIVTYTYISEVIFSDGGCVFNVPSYISKKFRNTNTIPSPGHKVNVNIRIDNFVAFTKNIDSRFKIDYNEDHILCKLETSIPLSHKIPILYNYKSDNKIYKFELDNYTMVMGNFEVQLGKDRNIDEIVFTVDCSGQLCKRKICQLKNGIINCLKRMPQNLKFNIILAGEKIKLFSDELVIPSPNNIRKAIAFCNSIKEYNGPINFNSVMKISLKMSKSGIIIINNYVPITRKINKLAQQFDQLSILNTCMDNNQQIFSELVANKGLSLFSTLEESIPENLEKILSSCPKVVINNPIFNLNLPQNWISCSPIISGQPSNIYGILNHYKEMDLFEVNGTDILTRITFLPSKFPFTKYQLGCMIAKKIIQDSTKIDPINLSIIEADFGVVTKYTSCDVSLPATHIMTDEKITQPNTNKHTERGNKKSLGQMILNRSVKKMRQKILSVSKQKIDSQKEIDCEVILYNYIDLDKYSVRKNITDIIHSVPRIVLNHEIILKFYVMCYIATYGTFKQFKTLYQIVDQNTLNKFKEIIKSIKKNCNCNLSLFDIILEWCEMEINI